MRWSMAPVGSGARSRRGPMRKASGARNPNSAAGAVARVSPLSRKVLRSGQWPGRCHDHEHAASVSGVDNQARGRSFMENIALLILCFGLGIILKRSGRLPDNAHTALNGFIIHISLPAVILLYVHRLRIDTSLVYPIVAPWMLFGIG